MEITLPQNGQFSIKRSSEVIIGEYVSLPELSPAEDFLFILGERRVDPAGLAVVDSKFGFSLREDGTRYASKVIACPEMDVLTEGALCLSGALSFATGISFQTGVYIGLKRFNRFVPECPEDVHQLRALNTERSDVPLGGLTGVEAFDNVVVDADFVGALAQRECVTIYVDALSAASPAAKFRDLWRVLELAFHAHGRELVKLLAEFPSTQRLGFDLEELEMLRALRGRLSHAASRIGILDIWRANQEAIVCLGRLWSLVDSVVLSKKQASRTLDVEELQPLSAFIAKNGRIETTSEVEDKEEWLATWGLNSPRFR